MESRTFTEHKQSKSESEIESCNSSNTNQSNKTRQAFATFNQPKLGIRLAIDRLNIQEDSREYTFIKYLLCSFLNRGPWWWCCLSIRAWKKNNWKWTEFSSICFLFWITLPCFEKLLIFNSKIYFEAEFHFWGNRRRMKSNGSWGEVPPTFLIRDDEDDVMTISFETVSAQPNFTKC